MDKKYGPLVSGNWSANHFESMLMQLREGNTFVIKLHISCYDSNWSTQELKIQYRVRPRNVSDPSYVWVTNDERRRIIRVLNDARIKK